MPASIGEGIEQRVAGAVTRDDIMGLIVVRLGDAREEALGELGLGRQDVFNPPRSVQGRRDVVTSALDKFGRQRSLPSKAGFLLSLLDVAQNAFLGRSEEHTSELQSLRHLVCRLLLEKKKSR